jgi:acyl-CoA synthetase (AMP-forming)/AMP-acid ligase II
VTAAVAPVYANDERIRPLLAPDGPFAVEDVIVDGFPVRSFVHAPRTIVEIFQMGRSYENLIQVVFEDERLTFGDIRRMASSLARQLRERFGVRQGDRVAIAMRNLPEFVIGFWSAALLGAIAVPLNAWWTGPELIYAVNDCEPRVVFADEERLERLTSAGRDLAGDVVLVGVRTSPGRRNGSVSFDTLAAGDPLSESGFAALGPDDPVTILYTSGTTGRPKGALGSNRATIANLMNMAFVAARESVIAKRTPPGPAQSASLAALPLFHVGGIASIVGGPMSGSKMVMMRKWSVEEGLALAKAEGVTNLGGVPTVARQILDYPGLEKLGLGVRAFPLGGASVPPDLPRRALETFGDSIQLLNGYGLTETTSAVVTNVGVEYAAHLDSVGRPNLTADLQVQSPDGQILGVGEVGELCFHSPQNVKEYWNKPEDTQAAFVGGWFHSGDLGYVDEDGFVYGVDRLKDVVIRGGENVYCAEVEAALFEYLPVADVAVVGLPDERMGELVCAAVVPRPGAELDLIGLRRFATSRLAAFKCPEALFVTDELPKTATGKTAKRELRSAITQTGAEVQRSG